MGHSFAKVTSSPFTMRVSAWAVGIIMGATLALAGNKEDGIAFLTDNKDKDGVLALSSGLQYKILSKGSGTVHPTPDSPCLCHYEGTLLDGTVFDSSYERGSPS